MYFITMESEGFNYGANCKKNPVGLVEFKIPGCKNFCITRVNVNSWQTSTWTETDLNKLKLYFDYVRKESIK